ncbi:hypothetical protein VCHENC02_3000 [Vibrio harveyi]|uniref:Uncharacterized protein n=1 Tax=Vibrio harveyi TaxID=669 RepID=A0A454CY61_VIBHA|nr:hypothetical protein VCHENC01_4222 [Vibrio harveyi]EKM31345.1 hypothetical protein VCHENC02_3000 [Vibrio harveyi]CAH1577809.1 conserved hypothetical protein [Vibrio harveyi]
MCKCGSMQIVQVKPSWADKLFGYSERWKCQLCCKVFRF